MYDRQIIQAIELAQVQVFWGPFNLLQRWPRFAADRRSIFACIPRPILPMYIQI
jgi:hypothetical protein